MAQVIEDQTMAVLQVHATYVVDEEDDRLETDVRSASSGMDPFERHEVLR
jgi:hypothetical protein